MLEKKWAKNGTVLKECDEGRFYDIFVSFFSFLRPILGMIAYGNNPKKDGMFFFILEISFYFFIPLRLHSIPMKK